MLHVAIVTLALLNGECPTCGPVIVSPMPSASTTRRLPARPALVQTVPCCIVGCTGQSCASCSRPLTPGAMPFDYRTDFDYPWSQAPCALPSMAMRNPSGPHFDIPGRPQPEEIQTPPGEASRRAKGVVSRARKNVLVSDLGPRATLPRR